MHACFKCGEIGHRISNCQKNIDMIKTGALAWDDGGRIIRGNGTYLHCIAVDEPFTAAVEQEHKVQMPQSNLVTFSEMESPVF